MKIVHLCLACFFPDNYSYQENMLPKFHKVQGYDVEVIASLETFDTNGKITYYDKASQYVNEHGISVTRLSYKNPLALYQRFRRYNGLKKALYKAKPDVLFVHGCQFLDIDIVIDYCKNYPDTKVYVDHHADFSNSATNWLSKNVLHKIVWRWCAQRIEPYTTKFYGVLPARVEFLKEMYKLPADKCELLVMGADDELVQAAAEPEVRARIREQYGIAEDDFLVMTGGKIDAFKTQTLLLMQAVQNIKNEHIKLIVFGSVTPELKAQVEELADGKRVQYIGWVQAKDSYEYFAAADLVVFPGRHSVFWEQVAAQGVPMLCKRWDGTTHVDLGGNVKFLAEDSVEEIQTAIEEITNEADVYMEMKHIAVERGMKEFAYSDIAKRSIEG